MPDRGSDLDMGVVLSERRFVTRLFGSLRVERLRDTVGLRGSATVEVYASVRALLPSAGRPPVYQTVLM